MDDQGLPRISGSYRLSAFRLASISELCHSRTGNRGRTAALFACKNSPPLPIPPAPPLPCPPSQFKFALFGKNRLRWAGYGQLMLGWRTADRQRTRIVECLIRIFCQYPLQLKSQEHNNG